MLKINLNNLYYDGRSLILNNKFKFIVVIALCLFSIGLGVSGAVNTINSEAVINIKNINIVLVINGTKSAFGYFFSRLFSIILLLGIIVCCSYKFIFTFVSNICLFVFYYISAKEITLVFGIVKFFFIPASICIIICSMAYLLIFSMFIIYTMEKSIEFGYYKSGNYLYCVSCTFRVCYIPLIPLIFISVVESSLLSVLTIGIVL